QEQLQEEIREKLDWIRGVQVFVELVDSRPSVPPVAPSPSAAETAVTVGVNQPVELHEPVPPAGPARLPVSYPAGEGMEHGRVLVGVPRTFYYNAIRTGTEHREPSPEERQRMMARTKDQITRRVNLVVPESWPVEVDTIPDDVSLGGPIIHSSAS